MWTRSAEKPYHSRVRIPHGSTTSPLSNARPGDVVDLRGSWAGDARVVAIRDVKPGKYVVLHPGVIALVLEQEGRAARVEALCPDRVASAWIGGGEPCVQLCGPDSNLTVCVCPAAIQ